MNELQKLCWKKLEEIKDFNHPLGYHFSYSNESAWKPENRFLILTLNPSSSNHDPSRNQRQEIAINSGTPWAQTEINDFFTNESENYKITPYIRTIFYELARLAGNSGNTSEQMKEIAFNYAKTECPIASFVPFRTKNREQITKEMYKFSEEQLWPEIFDLWLPEAIIVLSRNSYYKLIKIFTNKLEYIIVKQEELSINSFLPMQPTKFHFRYTKLKKDNKKTTIIYIPHPTGTHWEKDVDALPNDFGKHCNESGTPFRKFLENTLLNK